MIDFRKNFLKFNLYILSLSLLFLFISIITVEGIPINEDHTTPKPHLNLKNFETLASIAALIYCLFSYRHFRHKLAGSPDMPFRIKKIESINYEHLTFLATYVVPLVSFDFESGRQMIVLSLLLITMGIMYVKTNLFYANPALALLGFHIYRASAQFKIELRDDIVIISRDELTQNTEVAHIKLDDNVYYAKKLS